MLSSDQLADLRADIESELARLRRGRAGMDAALGTVELDQTSVGRVSRIDALQNQAMSKGLNERSDARYGALLAALERLDRGHYGTCETCGAPIPYGRLLAMPEATRCTGCAGR